jgi:hypothetical protein
MQPSSSHAVRRLPLFIGRPQGCFVRKRLNHRTGVAGSQQSGVCCKDCARRAGRTTNPPTYLPCPSPLRGASLTTAPEQKEEEETMATNEDLLTFLGNLKDLDAGGCPAPFISEVLYPYTGGCK